MQRSSEKLSFAIRELTRSGGVKRYIKEFKSRSLFDQYMSDQEKEGVAIYAVPLDRRSGKARKMRIITKH